jgi:FAD/FMN-containing dehydrogenase
VKPELVVYPKDAKDISLVLEYVQEKKRAGFDIAVSMRAAGTCMTGGSLCFSIVLDATK